MALRKAGANWVEGPDRFFDREIELEALAERARDGTHTLLTAQRRMGKTSLVRELLRRLAAEGTIETVFVDLEDAADAADAIAAIGAEAKSVEGAWRRIRAADAFLSWLRKNGQAHRGRVVMILSGSIGLEPILRYLERQEGGYRFVSGLLEDWWLARHGRHFVSIARRA